MQIILIKPTMNIHYFRIIIISYYKNFDMKDNLLNDIRFSLSSYQTSSVIQMSFYLTCLRSFNCFMLELKTKKEENLCKTG